MGRFHLFRAALLVCLISTQASAFSGSVTRDTTWTTDMFITGDVTIRNNATLTILPHLTITFTGYWKLSTVDWSVSRVLADSSIFTSTLHSPRAWASIWLGLGGGCRLRGCEICYADMGVHNSYDFNSVLVSGCHIHHNGTAVELIGGMAGDPEMPGAPDWYIIIENNLIEWNQVGIRNDWGRGGSIDGNVIRNNSEAGISLGDHSAGQVIRNQIVENQIGILIRWMGLSWIVTTIGGTPENANQLYSNVDYDFRLETSYEHIPVDMTAQYNDWGPVTTAEMNREGYPANITAIYDRWDDPLAGNLDYRNWIQNPEGIAEEIALSDGVSLGPVTPNPFRSSTRITFSIPSRLIGSPVTLTLLDAGGRRLRVFPDLQSAGSPHVVVWDGCDESGLPVPSGVYFLRIQAAGRSVSTQLVRAE